MSDKFLIIISVSGPKCSGKTRVLSDIAEFLASRGYNVKCSDDGTPRDLSGVVKDWGTPDNRPILIYSKEITEINHE
jgi:Ni2+-binding GTPase involved in maturation of urease and hydrogenase